MGRGFGPRRSGRKDLVMAAAKRSLTAPVQELVERAIEELMASLPDPDQLSPEEQRGIIARYTAVLEGNFIYWMTAAYLAVGSDEAHAIIEDNLREEVRDNHPGMLRRFAIAARAVPTETDALAVYRNLEAVRRFVGELSAVKTVLMMADRKSTRLNSSHRCISYAVFCLNKNTEKNYMTE